jgi:hypothetical protein
MPPWHLPDPSQSPLGDGFRASLCQHPAAPAILVNPDCWVVEQKAPPRRGTFEMPKTSEQHMLSRLSTQGVS